MAPLRRYIRLSRHHTMLALIFLTDPSDLHTWLVHPSKPALPRIVEALRDVVPAKIREELELERRTNKKKRLKTSDVVIGDDFEVRVYLKENTQSHAILIKHRVFGEKHRRLKSNSNKLGIGNDVGDSEDARILQEEDDDASGAGQGNTLSLDDIPLFEADQGNAEDLNEDDSRAAESPPPRQSSTHVSSRATRSSNRSRNAAERDRRGLFIEDEEEEEEEEGGETGDSDDSFEEMDVDEDAPTTTPNKRKARSQIRSKGKTKASSKRSKKEAITIDSASESESRSAIPVQSNREMQKELQPADEKKPLLTTTYEGYQIFGKALYMIVKRIHTARSRGGAQGHSRGTGLADTTLEGDDSVQATEGVLDEWMIMSQTIGEGDDE